MINKDPKVAAVVQARMGSQRFPGKSLADLKGAPIISVIIERLKASSLTDQVVIAIPDSPGDDVLADYLDSIGAFFFRGSELDVLARFYCAALDTGCATILRVCADNPLVCGSEVDRLIAYFMEADVDYAYNHAPINNLYPDGFGAEICSISTLSKIYEKAAAGTEREHVFNYIWNNENDFNIGTFDPAKKMQYPLLRFDVDTPKDLIYLNSLPIDLDMTASEIISCLKEGDLL